MNSQDLPQTSGTPIDQAPQYAAPASPQQLPQYAYPQYSAQALAGAAQQAFAPYSAPLPARVNVAGIVAFSLLVLVTVLGFFTPFVLRQAAMTHDVGLLVTFPLIRLMLALGAIVLGAVGARARSGSRLRWMAVGSIVAGSFLAIPLFLTTLSYASPSLFSFYTY